jgi:hypothetical protein
MPYEPALMNVPSRVPPCQCQEYVLGKTEWTSRQASTRSPTQLHIYMCSKFFALNPHPCLDLARK